MSFPSHEGDRTACVSQMANALKATPFHYVASSDISKHLENYVAPHNLVSTFASLPYQTANKPLIGYMNMTATFRATVQTDDHLVYLGWQNYSPAERTAVYSQWFRRVLQQLLFSWLTDW